MKEKLTYKSEQMSLSLGQNKIQAIRRKTSIRTACRIYREQKIGISGAVGNCDEELLYKRAENNLRYGIEYPVAITANKKYSINIDECKLSDETLHSQVEQILDYVSTNHETFTVNHKANLNQIEYRIENEAGLKLEHKDRLIELGLLLKKRGSSDILDTAFGYTGRSLELTRITSAISEIINAFENPVETLDESLPIVIQDNALLGIFQRDLNGKLFGNNASLFQGKLGTKVFNEAFNLRILLDPRESFAPIFDSEGTVIDEGLSWLIREGKLIRPFTDKRTAKDFGFDNTGCAGGAYDGVPTLMPASLEVPHTGKTLKTLLNGQRGILVVMAGGGDFTPDGIYASPVQLAYLTDGERLLAKMPQFTIKGSIYDIFGKNFVGASSDRLFTMGDERMLVVNMDTQQL